MAVLNLYEEKLTTYKFNKEENKFVFLQEISNKDGAQFEYPENLAISPDGTLLAVCMGTGGGIATASMRFYSIDVNTHRINPVPKLTLPPCNELTHSVKFSYDNIKYKK